MKKCKQVLSILLTVLLVALSVPVAGAAPAILGSGYCGGEGDGTNLTWTLYDDGRLIISGQGKMADYGYYKDVTKTDENGNETKEQVYVKAPWADESILGKTIDINLDDMDSLEPALKTRTLELTGYESIEALRESIQVMSTEEAANLKLELEMVLVGEYVFSLYALLSSCDIIVNEGITSIGNYAFENTGKSVSLPSTLVSIGEGAFKASSIHEITLPKNLREIGEKAFDGPIFTAKIDGASAISGLNEMLYASGTPMSEETELSQTPWVHDLFISDRSFNLSDLMVFAYKGSEDPMYDKLIESMGFAFSKEYYVLTNAMSTLMTKFNSRALPDETPLQQAFKEVFTILMMASYGFPITTFLTPTEDAIAIVNDFCGTSFSNLNEMFYEKEVEQPDGSFSTDIMPTEDLESALKAKALSAINGDEIAEMMGISAEEVYEIFSSFASEDIFVFVSIDDLLSNEDYRDYKVVPWLTIHTTCTSYAHVLADAAGIHLDLTHSWGAWAETKAATVDAEGVKTRACTRCGEKETESIPKLDKPTDPQPTDPTPTDPTTEPETEKPAEKLNIFQRIIQWIRDFFARLFGRK
ncbi:MAG: leucine-rich repeat protein [Clostridia bacterium]|nr:leucine-rich repeat protein [Clostridia bacterium]